MYPDSGSDWDDHYSGPKGSDTYIPTTAERIAASLPEPDQYFTIKGEKTIFKMIKVQPAEICVKAWEMEGPKGHRTIRMNRILLIEDIDKILEAKEV